MPKKQLKNQTPDEISTTIEKLAEELRQKAEEGDIMSVIIKDLTISRILGIDNRESIKTLSKTLSNLLIKIKRVENQNQQILEELKSIKEKINKPLIKKMF